VKKVLCALVVSGCLAGGAWAESPADGRFGQLAATFLESYLRHNPEAATTLGDHRFDGQWSDLSAAGVRQNLDSQAQLLRQLREIPKQELGPENQVDYDILDHHLEAQLWSGRELQELRWNPLVYNPGPALYALVARDFAPAPQRLESLALRLEKLPKLLEQARSQLDNPPLIHTQTAIQQNDGNLAFLRNDLEPFFQQAPELRPRLEAARSQAILALEDYGRWLEQDLKPRSRGDFRLGPDRFRKKLFYTLESSISAEELARRAEADLRVTQATMAQVARPLYKSYFHEDDASLSNSEVCRKVLDRLAEDRPNSQTIVPMAEQSLKQATAFVAQHKLVSLPGEECKIIEMPEFSRGVAIAYCDSPGPLEKGGDTFYAIAPTPSDWSEERVVSFYREYNRAMMDNLTVHEATPGHFLQLMHANRFKAPTRIRAVMQSGTFVEGWATYAEQLMVEHGYGGPEVKMQQLKMRLRLILNALLDQKVHIGGLQESEAIAWLKREGFQEDGEATGKWRRACLTSTQLSTYYLGNCEINDLVVAYRKRYPKSTSLEMHDRILSFGSPASRYVHRLLFP